MKVDTMNALYTASMIILAFDTAIVLTKIISKYVEKKEKEKNKE